MNELEKEALRYDLEALKKHVEHRKQNITIFEKAIQDEMAAIRREQQMITFLEEKAARQL